MRRDEAKILTINNVVKIDYCKHWRKSCFKHFLRQVAKKSI